MDRSDLPFRQNTEGFLFTPDGKILARLSDEGYLVFPGGGVEPGETPAQAFLREAREETGAVIKGPLESAGILKLLWGPSWAQTEKQRNRYQQYQGDELYFFIGQIDHIEEQELPEADYWSGDKLIPLRDALLQLRRGEPYPDDIAEYREFQIAMLEQIERMLRN